MHNWTGNYVVQSNSELRFYGSGPQLWYNSSPNGFSWNGYVNTNVLGGDPSVVKLSTTNYVIIYVGQPYATGNVKQADESLEGFTLYQNYPNPFNSGTNIKYQIPSTNHVVLRVFDVLGREVATLVDNPLQSGSHEVIFDASSLSNGVYYYRLTVGNFSDTKKLLLIR
jgi:hypothetical protein